MQTIIRPERPEEFDDIHELVRVAFLTAKVSDGDEQDFVRELRAGAGYLPELALVAEQGGELIGQVMLTQTRLEQESGARQTVLLLAPLAVRLENRCQGVGARLVEEALHRALALGWRSVFLCGDPAYYGRFGFKAAIGYGTRSRRGMPVQYVLGKELIPGALKNMAGILDCC